MTIELCSCWSNLLKLLTLKMCLYQSKVQALQLCILLIILRGKNGSFTVLMQSSMPLLSPLQISFMCSSWYDQDLHESSIHKVARSFIILLEPLWDPLLHYWDFYGTVGSFEQVLHWYSMVLLIFSRYCQVLHSSSMYDTTRSFIVLLEPPWYCQVICRTPR